MTRILNDNRIRVRAKETGQTGTIVSSEFNPNIYEKIKAPIEATITPGEFEVPGVLGKIGRFLGTEKIGRRIGAELAKIGPGGAEHREVLERARIGEEKGALAAGTTRTLETGGVTGQEALGSAMRTGLSLALPFAGKTLAPVGAGLKTLMGRQAIAGASFGLAGGVEEGMSNENIVKSAISGALIGAVFPLLGEGLKQAGKFLKDTPRRLYNSVFKSQKDVLRRELESEARGVPFRTTAEWALEKERISGGLESMAKESIKRLDSVESVVQKNIIKQTQPVFIDRQKYIAPLKAVAKRYRAATFTKTGQTAQQFIDLIEGAPAKRVIDIAKKAPKIKISQKDALNLRRFFDRLRSRPSFKLDPTLTPIQADLKIAADSLRGQLKLANPMLKKELEREMFLIRMIDNLTTEAVKSRNRNLLNLTDILLGGGGMASGFPGTGIGAAAAVRGFQLPHVQTGLGLGLQKIAEPAQRMLTRELPKGLGKVAPEIEKGARQLFIGGMAK